MFTPTLSAAALMLVLTPPNPILSTSFNVASADVFAGADSTHLITFDDSGDQSAEVVVWADSGNRVHVDASFADGRFLTAIVGDDGTLVEIDSDDPTEVSERMTAIGDYLAVGQIGTEGELNCLGGVILASSCLFGSLISCMVGSVAVACYCLPLVGDHPPGCD